jgi:iodotyrosine deiodinase
MEPTLIPYTKQRYSAEETKARSIEHLNFMEGRRTVRDFSSEPIDLEIIENIIMAASTAPSGANKQPWTFCVVTNAALKSKIRIEAEKEEYESYTHRMSKEWLDDLSHLGTNWKKPFLEEAPALIVVFRRPYKLIEGKKKQNYYVSESVGIACGFLLEAIHYCGLVALTHTPSPMNFLSTLLERPENEKPFLLIPIGYPKEVTMVPDIKRKTKDLVIVKYDNF